MPNKNYTIQGKVVDRKTKKGVPGLMIEAWDKDLIVNDLVGEMVADDQGKFRMEFTSDRFQELFQDRRPDLFFKIFFNKKEIHSTADNVIWNYETADKEIIIKIDFIPLIDDKPPFQPASVKIRGKLLNYNPEYKNLKIILCRVAFKALNDYDTVEKLSSLKKEKGFSKIFETALSEKESYEFTIQFDDEKKKLFIKGNDFVAYVVDSKGFIVGQSKLIKYANEWLDRGINGVNVTLRNIESGNVRTDEYANVLAKLKSYLPELMIDEDPESNKMAYVLNETNLKADDVYAMLYASNYVDDLGKLTEEKRIDYQELFYGLIKGSGSLIGPHWESVYTHLKNNNKYLKNAIKYEYIRKDLYAKFDDFLKNIEDIVAEKVVEEEKEELPIRKVTSFALTNKNKQKNYLTKRAKYTGNLESLHKSLIKENSFSKKDIESIEFANDLADLTGTHIPLMEKLKTNSVRTKITDLLELTPEELMEEIISVDLPENLAKEKTEGNEDELKKNYALKITRGLEVRFPSEITQQYAEKKPDLVGNKLTANINTFFKKMKDAPRPFNMRDHKLSDDYFKLVAKELKPEVVEDIKSLQRIMFIAPDIRTSFKLHNEGIKSANQVAAIPKHVFVTNHGSGFTSSIEAESFHDKSTDVAFYTENIVVLDAETGSSTVTHMAGNRLLTSIPRDLCECEHCRSIYGPAAYFVELMQFLRSFKTGTLSYEDKYEKPLELLINRRPDLQHIELSCKNTSTLIPHIDLVNEILEDIVVYGSLEKSKISSDEDGDLHIPHETGDSSSEELLATPQHTLSPAYKDLSEAKYPTSLPYHQPLDTIRTYLGNLKTNRYELMNMINSKLDSAAITGLSNEQKKEYGKKRNSIHAEYLHLDEETFKILTNKNFNEDDKAEELEQYYGYDSSTDLENNITKVREFLRRTDIKLTDLVKIVQTIYINPHLHLLEEINDVLKPATSGNLFNAQTSYSTVQAEYKFIMNILAATQTLPESLPSTFQGIDMMTSSTIAEWLGALSRIRKEKIGSIITIHQDRELLEEGSLLDYMSINYIKKIYGGEKDNDLFITTFTKLYKFIRLWRKLGWTVHELDVAITALMDKEEDYFYPEFIKKLSAVQQIKDHTKLTIEQILCFWTNINTRGERSLYEKLFLSKSISGLDTGFALDDSNNLPAGKMELHVVAIRAAYRISDEDFNLIVKYIGINISANNSFNIDNLTKVYRYVLLAKGFRVSINDVIQLEVLCQIDPFGSWDNEYPLLDYLQQLELIKSSDFKITDLAKICGFDSEKDIQDDQIAQWIVETKEQLIKINEEYRKPADDEIIEKTLLISRFEQAIAPEILDNILESFEIINNKTENKINELFDGIFGKVWTKPEINVDEYVDWSVEKKDAFQKTLISNALYRYLLSELNDIIRPTLLSDAFYSKLSQLIDCDEALVRQILPGGQSNTLNNKISENGLKISSRIVGDSPIFQLKTYLHPLQNGNYVLTVKSKKELSSITIAFDNMKSPAQAMKINQEYNFNAKDLNVDNFYTLNISAGTEITIQDIELYWKQGENKKEVIHDILFFPANFPELYKTMKGIILGLDRAIEFIEGFGLSVDEVSHVQRCKVQFGDINFLSIRYIHWKRINQYVLLRKVLPKTEKALLALFDIADKGLNIIQLFNELLLIMEETPNNAVNEGELKNQLKGLFKGTVDDYPVAAFYLAYITGWNIDDITELLKHESLDMDPASLNILGNEIMAAGFLPKIKMAKSLGISIAQLLAWGTVVTETEDSGNTNSFDKLQVVADAIKLGVKSKFDDDNWFSVARQLNNKIRENQQSALVAYLMVKEGRDHPDELYEYYLLDVQMKSQRETTRIKQAILSIQLFVQRCLLNLEKDNGVGVNILDRPRWEWIKNYRVWEANKKVFVNPENWLEPELRQDKSPFFKELESELMQNDISKDTVETALRNYLSKLDEVARLDVCGLYDDTGKSTEYVFARTSNAPYTYYFRTMKYKLGKKNRHNLWRWSPWEEVKVDIDTIEDGENSWLHLMPVVWKGRLMIFWPVFREKSKSREVESSVTIADVADKTTSDLKPTKYWEIHLAWSEYKDKKWSKKQISSEFISTYVGKPLSKPVSKPVPVSTEITRAEKNKQISLAKYGEDGNGGIVGKRKVYRTLFKNSGLVGVRCAADGLGGWTYKRQSVVYTPNDVNTIYENEYHPDYLKRIIHDDHKVTTYLLKDIEEEEFNEYAENILNLIKKIGGGNDYAAKTWIWKEDKTINVDYLENSWSNDIEISDDVNENSDGIYIIGRAKLQTAKTELDAAKKALKDALALVVKQEPAQPEDPQPEHPQPEHPQPWQFSFSARIYRGNLIIKQAGSSDKEIEFRLTSLHDKPKAFSGELHSVIKHPFRYFNGLKKVERWDLLESVDNGVILPKYKTYDNPTFIFQDKNRKYYIVWKFYFSWSGPNQSYFRFFNFYHPLVNEFTKILNENGTADFLDLKTQLLDETDKDLNLIPFKDMYVPADDVQYYPIENVDFNIEGAYSSYNWELFFHVPLFIATHLSKNNKFKEARDWFHYIFDPTSSEPNEEEEKRVWRFLPFRRGDGKQEALEWKDWRDHPFQPHYFAQMRGAESYKLNVIMKYLDNLIAWGDQHFRRYSMESLGEATQLYVMANLLLGPRPEFIPERGEIKPETYFSIMHRLDAYSNVNDLEYEFSAPFSGNIEPGEEYDSTMANILGLGIGKLFCIPFNSKLLEYWDTVEQRLFNIRHGLDINGIRRPVALFEPELDPGMLVGGAASGLSIAGMLGQLNAPIPYYRFSYMLQKAIEICGDIKALGSNLLSALEKKDGEELSLLRSSQELDMLNLVKQIKQLQRDESAEALEGLIISRAATLKRMKHYLDLLGMDAELIPDEEAAELTEIEADVDLSLVEIEDVEGLKLIPMEKEDLDKAKESNDLQIASSSLEVLASVMNLIPSFSADGKPLGVGAGVSFGGSNIGAAISAFAKNIQIGASHLSYSAARASKIGSYFRREQDWVFQANVAGRELIQMNSQLKAAQLRLGITEKELINHDKQIENAEQSYEYLSSKFTNNELYSWMKHRLTDIYKQSFDMAFDLAKKAERAYQFERGEFNASFIQYNYWNSSKEGLLAGESLHLALRQMEKSFLEKNKRELEISKNISLLRLNPEELLRFKITGSCEFELPEALFDLDFPGHYMRRIKSVSITIPCIVGPYTSINCTLRQLSNEIRLVNTAGVYPRIQDGDKRFMVNFASAQSVATSNGQNDSGLFELNFRDERYLPFEGSGAISRWKLEMETEFRQFDYDTISDVILTINYTARDGGETLKSLARDHLHTFAHALSGVGEDQGGFYRAFNLKQEFPNSWNKLKTEGNAIFNIRRNSLPYFSTVAKTLTVGNIIWYVKCESGSASIDIDGTTVLPTDPPAPKLGEYEFAETNIANFVFDENFEIVTNQDIQEIIMIVFYVQEQT